MRENTLSFSYREQKNFWRREEFVYRMLHSELKKHYSMADVGNVETERGEV
jgi:hypothetical protein